MLKRRPEGFFKVLVLKKSEDLELKDKIEVLDLMPLQKPA